MNVKRPKRCWILAGIFLGLIPRLAQSNPAALTWEDCVHETSIHNPDLISAEQTFRRARLQVGISRSDYFPAVTGTGGYEASNSTNTATFNPLSPVNVDTGVKHQVQAGVSLDQNIFTGFQTQAGVKKSKALVDDAIGNLAQVKSQVSFDLKGAFARLLFFQQQRGVDQKIVERRQNNVRFIDLRYEGGRENKGSLMRNQALLDQAKFQLAETERSLRVARRALAKVLGRDYTESFSDLSVKGDFKTHFPKEMPDFTALTPLNPIHMRGDAQVRAAHEDVRIAKGNLLPSVDASASFLQRKFTGGNSNGLWSAGVNVNYPFFTGGKDIYNVRSNRAQEYLLQENLRSTDNQTTVDLKQSYIDFKDAIDNIRVQQNFLSSAEVRAEIARSQYANGLLSYQDWDTIENDLINNQRTILESLRDAVLAEAAWEKAQGTGELP